MTSPDHRPTPDPTDPLADRLRDAFDFLNAAPGSPDFPDFPPPPARVWAGVAAGLQPAPTRLARWRPALTGVLGVVVGVLLMGWWGGVATSKRVPSAAKGEASVEKRYTRAAEGVTFGGKVADSHANVVTVDDKVADSHADVVTVDPKIVNSHVGVVTVDAEIVNSHVGVVTIDAGVADSHDDVVTVVDEVADSHAGVVTVNAEIAGSHAGTGNSHPESVTFGLVSSIVPDGAGVLLPLIQAETTYAALPAADSSAETRAARRRALLTGRAALATLAHRTDSLLLTLGVAPEPVAAADSLLPFHPSTLLPFRKWSVALVGAPELSFLALQAPAADTLAALRRTHEQGRGGWQATLLAERRLTPRLSVVAGAGLSQAGAELRLTDRRTHTSTRLDSTISVSVQDTQITVLAYSVRIVQQAQLSPLVNFNNQIIGYDTVYVPRQDTVWTKLTWTNRIEDTRKTYTPHLVTREEVSARILRPSYRFVTVPVLVRYRLGRAQDWTASPTAPRWWADVALGAQVQVFLGGTQLRTEDGRTFRTERVGAAGGPFRSVSLALLGQVGLNYALTGRLTATLTPTVRWQAQSVYKPSTGLTQRPTTTGAQVGARWSF